LPLHRIELPGLDAANLLGYMAALGVLRTLRIAEPDADVRMSWTEAPSWWAPVVHHSSIATADDLTSALHEALTADVNPAWAIADDLNIAPDEFRDHAQNAVTAARQGRADALRALDFLAAFGSDASMAKGPKQIIADTEFRTMSGAGHQHFLGFMRDLHESTTAEHLFTALFEAWEYSDEKPSMRWDPNDYRPHALRAEDPSTDPIRTVRGANRLAIEALPLFPTMPRLRNRLHTIAFDSDSSVHCPVWSDPLEYATVASLLALMGKERKDDENQRQELRRLQQRGVVQIFRATRFTEGKYRNFSPSVALL